MNSTTAVKRVPADSCLSRRCFKINIHMWFKHFSNWCFCTGVSACMQALRAGSPFPAVLWVSWTYFPVVSKAMGFCAPSLQLCDPDVGTNPLVHRKKFHSFYIPPKYELLYLGSYFSKTISASFVSMYPFDPLLWSCYSSSFQVFLRGNYSTCRYSFFCPEEEASSSSS